MDSDFNYELMYEMISNMNKSSKEKCLVCHLPIEELEVELQCKHQYHFDCIDTKKKNGSITCHYCGLTNKLNLEQKNIKPNVKPVVKKPTYLSKSKGNTPPIICKFKIVTGARTGQICERENCYYHKKTLIEKPLPITENIVGDKCESIIKTGIKKGEQCGRINCYYHNINI
jgi:hypothetical protein